MRTDVKLGLVTSLAVVAAVAWYFSESESPESLPVAMNEKTLPALAEAIDGGRPRDATPEIPIRPPIDTDVITWNFPDDESETGDQEYVEAPQAEPADADTSSLLADLFDSHPEGSFFDDGVRLTQVEPSAGRDEPVTLIATTPAGDSQPTPSSSRNRRPVGRRKAIAAAPPTLSGETHTVVSGDTMAGIAMRYFGDAAHLAALLKANPHVADAQSLAVGTVIAIPGEDDHRVAAPRPSRPKALSGSKGEYVVRAGDTLTKIARRSLGDAKRWKDLYALNSETIGDDPGRLKVGHVLKLPPR